MPRSARQLKDSANALRSQLRAQAALRDIDAPGEEAAEHAGLVEPARGLASRGVGIEREDENSGPLTVVVVRKKRRHGEVELGLRFDGLFPMRRKSWMTIHWKLNAETDRETDLVQP